MFVSLFDDAELFLCELVNPPAVSASPAEDFDLDQKQNSEGPSGKLQEPSLKKREVRRVEVFTASQPWRHRMIR